MAVDSGMLTQGTDFRISEDGVTFISFGCPESWAIDSPERAEIDTTCLGDTSKTFKFGLSDSGTLTVDLVYEIDGAGQILLEGSYGSPEAYDFEVEYSDNGGITGTIKSFSGYVTSLSETGAKDDVIRSTVSIKISGDVTVAAPTL